MNLTHEPDGVARCDWVTSDAGYLRYHDTEWGRRVRGERELFERLSLEVFQAGLSWLTILRKRENFRRAFASFDPERVAQYTDADRERLLDDSGIVRNARKVDATIVNARAVLELRSGGGLEALIESHAPTRHVRPSPTAAVIGSSAESKALATELKARGFRHVGPTTCYSLFQACGFVNDHVMGCAAGDEIEMGKTATAGTANLCQDVAAS